MMNNFVNFLNQIMHDTIHGGEPSRNPRKFGNTCFKDGDYSAALQYYNKALIQAGDNEAMAALAYFDRSAVYLKLKFFKHCLHNLNLAEPHFPPEKIQKLHDRRARCTRLMNERQDMQVDAPDFFDQLSYPANPKLPFFIDALELRENETFGRHIITTKDLKAGDVVGEHMISAKKNSAKLELS